MSTAIGGQNYLTLEAWAKRLDPDGKGVANIVEMLNQKNEELMDMGWIEGNLPVGHRTTIRTGLPSTYWYLVNQGVPSSSSETQQVDEMCGMLKTISIVDEELAILNGNVSSLRLSEALAATEALSQQMSQTMWYGNSGVNPEQFLGFSPRYSTTSNAQNAQNIIKGGGSTSVCASIWLVVWGEQTVHGIFPRGSKAGLEREDWGKRPIQVTSPNTGLASGMITAYQEDFKWKAGLSVKDWRYVVRICNIDTTQLALESGSAADLFDLMQRALNRPPSLKGGKPVFYMNRTVREFLGIQARLDVQKGGQLKREIVDGWMQEDFQGVPVRISDALLNTEAAVS